MKVVDTEKGKNDAPRSYYGYVIVAASFVMMIIIWGTAVTFGVFFEPFVREFGWTRTVTSGASALNNAIFGVLCIFSAGLTGRFGPRWVMTVCGVILGLSYLLMAQLSSAWELYLYFGLFTAIGMSPYIPLLSLVPKWFKTKRGRMNAIVMSGMGLGIMVVPPLAGYLISTLQWRNSLKIIGIFALLAMVGTSQFLKDPLPSSKEKDGYALDQKGQTDAGLTLGQAIQTRQFALLCILYFSFLFCLMAITVHIVIHVTGLNIAATRAAYIFSLIGGACIVGMHAMGNLADRFGNRMALSFSYSLMGLSLVWLIWAKSEGSLYLFSLLFGFSYGGIQVLFSPLVAELFGIRSHGVVLSTVALVGTVGAVGGPVLAGYLFDALGSYAPSFVVCAALAFTGLVSTSLLPKRTPSCGGKGNHNPASDFSKVI